MVFNVVLVRDARGAPFDSAMKIKEIAMRHPNLARGCSGRLRVAAPGRLSALLLAALFAAVPASPQTLYGSLTGNVTDESGGVAAQVKVQATNVGTNVVKTATTDARGNYLFADLHSGVYSLSFEA